MPERALRLCIVGCGAIAGAYEQALQRCQALRLRAAVDPVPARADALVRAHDAAAHTDLELLLANGPECDAALVLTPPDTHEAVTVRCLEAGLHVLCEKPLAPTTAAAERMLARARAAGRLLMMGSKFRYTEDVVATRGLLEAGAIGDVLLFENVFCAPVDMRGRWNSVRRIAGGGVLVDNGCHAVDVARFLLGPIARVQAQFGRPLQQLEVEDTARLSFESAPGAIGTVDLSWSVHKQLPWYVRLTGSHGVIEIGWRASRWQQRGGDWVPFGRGYDKVAAFGAQLRNFAGAIDGAQAPVITDADALASVQVIEAAYRSAADRRWHDLR